MTMQSDSRNHTFKSIARDFQVSKRTVINWFNSFKESNGGRELGVNIDNARRFTDNEVDLLISHAGRSPVSQEVEAELVPEAEGLVKVDAPSTVGGAIVNFNFRQVNIRVANTDTTQLETEAERMHLITAQAFGKLSQVLTADLVSHVNLALEQNRHAVAGIQAKASTDALNQVAGSQ